MFMFVHGVHAVNVNKQRPEIKKPVTNYLLIAGFAIYLRFIRS
jgi:hypothetical protein